MNSVCMNHSGILSDVGNLKESDERQWVMINRMQGWVISAMAAVLLQVLVFIGGIAYFFITKG